jgi:hypothetical protein
MNMPAQHHQTMFPYKTKYSNVQANPLTNRIHLLDDNVSYLLAGRGLSLLSQHATQNTPENEVNAFARVDSIYMG